MPTDLTLNDYTPEERDILDALMRSSGKTLDEINPRWCLLQAWAIGELEEAP